MPLIKVQTNLSIDSAKKTALLQELSTTVSEIFRKPESYLMGLIEQCDGILGGNSGPIAFVEIRGIGGFSASVNNTLSAAICKSVEAHLGIEGKRVYINFLDVKAENWGCDSSTFG